MNQLSLEDAKFLKKHFHKLTNLQKIRDGIIKPESPKGKRLLSVLAGKLLPKTQYERAFLHWTQMNEPNLFEYISEKIDENKRNNNIDKLSVVFKYPSNHKDKKLSKKQKEQQIEANHRKSGYHKQTVKIVSGGLPSLGKKR
jgi:hypothetical protein